MRASVWRERALLTGERFESLLYDNRSRKLRVITVEIGVGSWLLEAADEVDPRGNRSRSPIEIIGGGSVVHGVIVGPSHPLSCADGNQIRCKALAAYHHIFWSHQPA